jgi:hypothetical protein
MCTSVSSCASIYALNSSLTFLSQIACYSSLHSLNIFKRATTESVKTLGFVVVYSNVLCIVVFKCEQTFPGGGCQKCILKYCRSVTYCTNSAVAIMEKVTHGVHVEFVVKRQEMDSKAREVDSIYQMKGVIGFRRCRFERERWNLIQRRFQLELLYLLQNHRVCRVRMVPTRAIWRAMPDRPYKRKYRPIGVLQYRRSLAAWGYSIIFDPVSHRMRRAAMADTLWWMQRGHHHSRMPKPAQDVKS